MTQDQTNGRQPAPSFTPISATRNDDPKQTEFRLVSPAPPEADPEEDAATSPTTPVPAVPGQARRDAPDDDARPGTADGAARTGGRLADGEELMPGPDAGESLPPAAAEDEPPGHDAAAEEPLPSGAAGEGDAPLARADEELLPSGLGQHAPLAPGRPDDEPLLSGVEELRAGWQRVRVAFVDNPRGAVAEAAGLADEAAEALAAALRDRRQRIRATWDGDGQARDTEALRLALLRYQALFAKIVGD